MYMELKMMMITNTTILLLLSVLFFGVAYWSLLEICLLGDKISSGMLRRVA